MYHLQKYIDPKKVILLGKIPPNNITHDYEYFYTIIYKFRGSIFLLPVRGKKVFRFWSNGYGW